MFLVLVGGSAVLASAPLLLLAGYQTYAGCAFPLLASLFALPPLVFGTARSNEVAGVS